VEHYRSISSHKLQRKQMTIATNENINETPMLNHSHYPLVFTIINKWGLPFEQPNRVYNIKPKMWTRDDKQEWSSYDLVIENLTLMGIPILLNN
jgi:hypothetical protein